MTVKLVFIHGWGFNKRFWDALSALLPDYQQERIDLGFFGDRNLVKHTDGKILIGHSFGFTHGIRNYKNWRGWIAINSFPRFVPAAAQAGCVPVARLMDMRKKLQTDAKKTLRDFYALIGAKPVEGPPNLELLLKGLDELREADVSDSLRSPQIPGLALSGANDPLVSPAISEELGQMAHRGGLMRHEKAGHLLPQTEPLWCARAIDDFLQSYCA